MDPGLFFGGGGGGDCRTAAAFGKGPEKTLANYKACIARVNSEEHYREYAESGFYVLERRDCSRDTRQEVLTELENHFRLNEEEGSR